MTLRHLSLTIVIASVCVASFTSPASADSIRSQQWHLRYLDVTTAQTISQGDGVLVAVADTGVDTRLPELASGVVAGFDFSSKTDGREDLDGHGTAMAGLIGARGKGPNKEDGILGIAPKATILPVRVFNGGIVDGLPTNLGAGIDWAVAHGAKVICIAISASEDPTIKAAVDKALATDVVVVAGVGNTPKDTKVAYPARLSGVLSVAGVDQQGNHAAVSATGPQTTIAAPAVDILSTGPSMKYRTASGTSDATAIVAGVVALIRSKYPQLSGPEVIHRLTYTARDAGPPGRDDQFGFGIVDPVKALTAEVPPLPSAAPSVNVAAPKAEPHGIGAAYVFLIAAGLISLALLVLLVVLAVRRSRRRPPASAPWKPRPLPPPMGSASGQDS